MDHPLRIHSILTIVFMLLGQVMFANDQLKITNKGVKLALLWGDSGESYGFFMWYESYLNPS